MSVKYIPILSLFLISCSLFGDEPDSTDYANVWDPNSDFYKPPKTRLLDFPDSLIDKHIATFIWESTRTGSPVGIDTSVIDTSEYSNITWSYSLNGKNFTLADTIKTVTFNYLTDTLNYFEVRTHYPNGEIEDPPTHYEFTVDEIKGPSLIFHPRQKDEAIVGNSFKMVIYAEEVVELTGTKIVLEYSPDSLIIESARAPADENNILFIDGGTYLFMDPILPDSSGILTLNIAVAGADLKSVSGTGPLAILTITSKISGTSFIEFRPESIFRDSTNSDILKKRLVEGRIIAKEN